MQNNETIKRHAGLVDDMATTLGVDLEEAVLRGEITPDEVVDAVLSGEPDAFLSDGRALLRGWTGFCRRSRAETQMGL